MKKIRSYMFFSVTCVLSVLFFSSCSTGKSISRKAAYPEMYRQHYATLLVMPPINKTNKVEAKEFFFTTLSQPLCERGYYVIPPYVSMEVFKNESAYDADVLLDRPLDKFGSYFGADMALFTIIHRWEKMAFGGVITVEVEYIVKSISTNATLYSRRGVVKLDTSVRSGASGLLGGLVDLAATAISTAATPHVKAARACNTVSLSDFPSGKYSPAFETDSISPAGAKNFKVSVNSGTVK
jgi:hypothetical protein